MTLQLVIPILNEEVQLAESVRQVRRFLAETCPLPVEIVIADNGSTDGSWVIAGRLASEYPNVRAVHLDERGRGRALRRVWEAGEAEVLSYMDVDLSTDLADFLPLLEALTSGRAEVAIGSRLLPAARVRRSWARQFLSVGYNWLLKGALDLRVSDAQCGCKAITRQAAAKLLPQVQDNGWFFDTELLWRAQEAGLRIYEQPVRWVEDRDSRVKILPTVLADLRGLRRLRRELRAGGALANSDAHLAPTTGVGGEPATLAHAKSEGSVEEPTAAAADGIKSQRTEACHPQLQK